MKTVYKIWPGIVILIMLILVFKIGNGYGYESGYSDSSEKHNTLLNTYIGETTTFIQNATNIVKECDADRKVIYNMNKLCNTNNKRLQIQLAECKEEKGQLTDMSEQGFYNRENMGLCR